MFTVFADAAAKVRWKSLRDNFRKELKKQISLDRETVLHRRRLSGYISRHFSFCDVMEPGKTSDNITVGTSHKPISGPF